MSCPCDKCAELRATRNRRVVSEPEARRRAEETQRLLAAAVVLLMAGEAIAALFEWAEKQ